MPTDPDYPPAYRRARRQSPAVGWGLLVAFVVLGFLLGAALLWFLGPHLRPGFQGPATNPDVVERKPDPKSPFDPDEQEAITIFKTTRDSVVNVDTVRLVRNRLDMKVQEQQTGTGSGFFWDADGRIVTNYHVVREAVERKLKLKVVIADSTAFDARMVGGAPDYDLAVIQIAAPREKVKPIKVGTSRDLEVGQKAFAIGNPFGLSLTMTRGIISALDRQIESLTDRPITGAIQTDAPINPGNSGGPLLDKDGRLIGVNSSIVAPGGGGNVGIGFAIPVDTVNEVVTEIIKHGKLPQPDIGLTLVNQTVVRRAGFPTGVMVRTVEPGGPADKAGLQGVTTDPQTGDVAPGDLIVKVDGEEVRSNQEFARKILSHKPGDRVKLTVERGDQTFDVVVTLRGV